MTKADRQIISELLENQKAMEIRLRELEAGGHAGAAPTTDEAETAYLKLLARTGGYEAIREYQKGKRLRRAA